LTFAAISDRRRIMTPLSSEDAVSHVVGEYGLQG
jgi:hypothetical protein